MAENPGHNGDERPRLGGYIGAILVAAFGHVALIAFAVFVAPGWLRSDDRPPPSYTVKIVDTLPAGDLGTHLPRLAPPKPREEKQAQEPKPEEPKPPELKPPPDNDKEAIALNTKRVESPTPTPTPEPTPEPTAENPKPTPRPTPTPAKHPPTPKPTPNPKAKTTEKTRHEVKIAKAEPTPGVKERLAKLKEQLLAQHLKAQARKVREDEEAEDTGATPAEAGAAGGGPVVANVASGGSGYGVGPGTGSAGIQQDLDFLLYYRTVQERIKKAWSFTGGSGDLTATVDFAIAADGTLTSVKIAQSSNDSSFDDSVLRAIRRAAPFPPPPDKYRSQFTQGIEALFKLGELKAPS
jgi:TonB family protein